MKRLAVLVASTLAAASHIAAAQSPDAERWQLALEDGSYVWDIRLHHLNGDLLVFRQADTSASVSVGRITEVRLLQKSEMRLGEGPAGALGALTGSDDEIYDLSTMDFAAKLRAIQQILLAHPPRGVNSEQ